MKTFQRIQNLLQLYFNTKKIHSKVIYELKEVIDFLEEIKPEEIDIIGITEEEFSAKFLNVPKNKKRYKDFKQKLLGALEILLALDIVTETYDSKYKKDLIKNHKNVFLANSLSLLREFQLAKDYATSGFNQAQKLKHELNSFVFSTYLSTHFLHREMSLKNHLKYNAHLCSTFEQLTLSAKLEQFFFQLNILFLKGIPGPKSIPEEIISNYHGILNLQKKLQTLKHFYLFFTSVVTLNLYLKKYDDSISYYEEGIYLMNLKDPENNNHGFKIAIILLAVQTYIHLLNYKAGKAAIEKAYQIQGNLYTHNYFAILELEIALNLRCGHYQDALENYLTYYNHKHKKNIYAPNKESWVLYEAYIYFLTKAKLVDSKKLPDHIQNRRFRMGKFLNEVPRYSKDKKGMNVAVLFAQIMIFLAERKYELVIDRMDALKSYRYRHLKKNSDMYRSNLFIRMLEFLPETGFDKKRSDWRAKQYLEKLEIPPRELPYKVSEIEIIKFEKLWKHVLEQLPNRRPRHYSSKASELPK